jgi:hypothetical protein
MAPQRYRRRDRPGVKYVAFQVGGLLDPLPHWFHEVVEKGQARIEDDCLAVLTITGHWRKVREGGWIILQQNYWLWEMDAATMDRLFYKVD